MRRTAAASVACTALLAVLACSKGGDSPTSPPPPPQWPTLTGNVLVTVGPVSASGSNGFLLRQALAGGATQTISSQLLAPIDVVTGPDGNLYGLESFGYNGACHAGCGALVRVNATTGAVTVIADSLPGVRCFAFEPGGTVLIATNQDTRGVLRRINVSTGAKSIVFGPVPEVQFLDGIAVAASGQVYACADLSDDPRDAVIRINPANGTMVPVTRGGKLSFPTDLLIDSSGQLFVVSRYNYIPNIGQGNGGITKVDPATGAQTTVSSGGEFEEPSDFATAGNGEFLVLQRDELVRVKPGDGSQLVVNVRNQAGWPSGSGQPSGIEWKP